MRKLFICFDDYLNTIYEKFTAKFIGKVIIKIISEVLLAALVSGSIFLGTSIYENNKKIKDENSKLEQIYISVSNEYIDSLFGKPYISINESETLKSNFYSLNDIILRTVTEDDVVIAYFITSQNERRKIPVTSIDSEKHYIGKTNYSKVDFPNYEIKANTL